MSPNPDRKTSCSCPMAARNYKQLLLQKSKESSSTTTSSTSASASATYCRSNYIDRLIIGIRNKQNQSNQQYHHDRYQQNYHKQKPLIKQKTKFNAAFHFILKLLILLGVLLNCINIVDAAATKVTVIDAAATTTTITTTTTTKLLSTSALVNVAATNASLSSSAAAAATTATLIPTSLHLRKRHRKRNSNWYDYYNFNENTTALEWSNPCGGFYVPSLMHHEQPKKKSPKQIYNLLKKAAGNEYRTLNNSQQDIDISNIRIWFLHDYNYKFLPKLKINSSIALKRWYRNMQTYVASFAYLRRVQLRWDRRHPKKESRTARELKHLLLSSRSMLCELETAVNNSYPVMSNSNSNGDTNSTTMNGGGQDGGNARGVMQQRNLHQISRAQMNKRLKLLTKRRNANSNGNGNGNASTTGDIANTSIAAGIGVSGAGGGTDVAAHEADSLDLRFVKYYYYQFLKKMWKLLRRHTKSTKINTNRSHQQHFHLQQQQPHQHQHQHHQKHNEQQQHVEQNQQQKQKQQKMRRLLSVHRRNQRDEYNEVEKPLNAANVANVAGIKKRKHGKRSNISRH